MHFFHLLVYVVRRRGASKSRRHNQFSTNYPTEKRAFATQKGRTWLLAALAARSTPLCRGSAISSDDMRKPLDLTHATIATLVYRATGPLGLTGPTKKDLMKDKRLYHSVANQITKLIDDGVYPPESRLPGERELAEKFGVSRVTIREAEIALQAVGRIRIKTGSGVYVQKSSEPKNGGLPDVTAFELTEARKLFESEAAALAATHMDDETLSTLAKCIEDMRSKDPADAAAADQADQDFHLTIAAASGNAAIRHVIEVLWKIRDELEPIKKIHKAICASDATIRGNEHSEVFDALCDRDPDAARTAMRQHFNRLLEAMLDATEEQAFEEVRRKSTESRQRFLKSARS